MLSFKMEKSLENFSDDEFYFLKRKFVCDFDYLQNALKEWKTELPPMKFLLMHYYLENNEVYEC